MNLFQTVSRSYSSGTSVPIRKGAGAVVCPPRGPQREALKLQAKGNTVYAEVNCDNELLSPDPRPVASLSTVAC